MTDRKTVGTKVDPELWEQLDQMNINRSAAMRQFLQELAASGQSTEAAMAVRKDRLENKLSEAKGEVRRIEAELERIDDLLDRKATKRRELFEQLASAEITGEWDAHHEKVQELATEVGMTPQMFIQEFREWSE